MHVLYGGYPIIYSYNRERVCMYTRWCAQCVTKKKKTIHHRRRLKRPQPHFFFFFFISSLFYFIFFFRIHAPPDCTLFRFFYREIGRMCCISLFSFFTAQRFVDVRATRLLSQKLRISLTSICACLVFFFFHLMRSLQSNGQKKFVEKNNNQTVTTGRWRKYPSIMSP